MNRRTKGAILTAFAGICWGLSGSVGQYLFQVKGMDSSWLVPMRLGVSGIVLLLYCFVHYGRKALEPFRNRADAMQMIVYGLFGISFCQFTYFLAIQLSNAASATVFQNTSPVFILAVSCLQAHRKPSRNEVLAVFFAVAGVFLMSTHGDISSLSASWQALLVGLFSAFCVMIYNCIPKRVINTYPPALLQAWAFVMGGIFFSLVFRIWTIHYVPDLTGWLGVAFVALVGNILAFICYITGIRMIGPEKGILYAFSEPLTAALITMIFLHTPFTLFDGLGFVCEFIMLVLISRA